MGAGAGDGCDGAFDGRKAGWREGVVEVGGGFEVLFLCVCVWTQGVRRV